MFEIRNYNLWYNDFHALININLNISDQQIFGLIGPSGCGKSTLLRSLNWMHEFNPSVKTNGNILLDGQSIFAMDHLDLRMKVGMVFQKPNPFPMSIYDNVAYGLKVNGIKNKAKLDLIVQESLQAAALWDEVKDRLHQSALGLSGGQQQRLCIARTIAVSPKVVLMDEPTSALDPIATSHIEELILQLKEKYTIIIVTHNMAQALRICDQTAFFLQGEVIEVGSSEQLFMEPKHQKTQEYITGRFG